MTEKLEKLITYAIADGVITDKEREILVKNANEEGLDLDEFEMILNARLHEKEAEIQSQNNSFVLPIEQIDKKTSTKVGEIKKCTSCGALVESFQTKCKDCGIEFRNIEAVNSIKNLINKIQEIEKSFSDNDSIDKQLQKSDLIEQSILNFPIPNTKEDLLEFIAFSISKAGGFLGNSIDGVWSKKCDEALTKLEIMSISDKTLIPIVEKYQDKLNSTRKKSNLQIIGLILIVILLGGASAIVFYFSKK